MRYETAAKEAFWAVWHRRSSAGLIGAGIDAETGQWVNAYTGIGAGIDSFFEYAFKSYVLLSSLPPMDHPEINSPHAFLATWRDAHAGIKRHMYRDSNQHPHYLQVDLYTGATRAYWIDSLSAYYPGLLALSGELDEAIETHLLFAALWTRYSALPERWSAGTGNIESGLRWWGGRPEFIESTWYIYRATSDPWYLHVGEMTLRDIKRRCWTKCGWAGLQDVRTGEQTDRMESFFLGETSKYLYLLFDETHPLNHLDAPVVFTTEGHPLIIPKSIRKKPPHAEPIHDPYLMDTAPTCPLPPSPVPLTISATAARSDLFHAASLARLHQMPTMEQLDSPLVEFNADHPSISLSDIRSPSNYTYYPWTLPPEYVPTNAMSSIMLTRTTFDLSFPNLANNVVNLGALRRTGDGVIVNSMSGLRLGMVREETNDIDHSIPNSNPNDLFRVYAVSNVMLGRDEKVLVPRGLIADFNPIDPYFTRTRNIVLADLVIDAPPDVSAQTSPTESPDPTLNPNASFQTIELSPDMISSLAAAGGGGANKINHDNNNNNHNPTHPDPSFLSSLLANLQNMLSNDLPLATFPLSAQATPHPSLHRTILTATLPTGPGAAPLPETDEPRDLGVEDAESPLLWQTLYFAGRNCDERLPPQIPKSHNVIVIERGGCSFSTKLANIPAFAPSARSLQLVVIVSFPGDDEGPDQEREARRTQARRGGGAGPANAAALGAENALIQPLLDETQMLAAGIARPHPIPMVMVAGGEETLGLLRRAGEKGGGGGVGVRRRWVYMSQGVRIGNLIVV